MHGVDRSTAATASELRCSITALIGYWRRVSVQSANKKKESAALESAARKSAPAPKRAKLSVLLVTRDDQLWPQVGGNLGQDLVLKQVDTIDELLSTTPSGQP